MIGRNLHDCLPKFQEILILLAVFCLLSQSLRAEVRVDITRGHLKPLPIAISNFFGEGEIPWKEIIKTHITHTMSILI